MTEGVFGNSPWGFLTGEGDIGYGTISDSWRGEQSTGIVVGADEISLADLMKDPSLSLAQTASNFRNNMFGMAVAAATTGIGFRVGRALLRRPIASVNRNIMKPLLGAAIKV